jgi:uncharacterized protein
MNLFIDTSAILAILNVNDQYHPSAKNEWTNILGSNDIIFCSNYIIVETIAILQRRFGTDAVRLFSENIQPLFNLVWVDETIHNTSLSILKTINLRDLSLVDCTSFEVIRKNNIEKVFTFDRHFADQGFKIVPN